jgi:cyclopropane fatty-acyl-phospholipid synthase-like methyltransferase
MTSRPAWMFDELRDFGFSDPGDAAAYERDLEHDPAEDETLLDELGVSASHTLVDIGCGAGHLAIAAARRCRRAVGVDVSAAMLVLARENAERAGVTNIDFARAGFLTYEHNIEPADFVVSVHALHHLPDFWKMQALLRVAGMLRPGGVLYLRDLVYSFDPADTAASIETWFASVTRESMGRGFPRSFFEEHVREEYSTYTWLLEPMIERAGFRIARASYNRQAYARYVCVKDEAVVPRAT